MTMHQDYAIVNGRRIVFATSAARQEIIASEPAKAIRFDLARAAERAENLLKVIGEAIDQGYTSEPLIRTLDRLAFLSETLYCQAISPVDTSPAPMTQRCTHCDAGAVTCAHCLDGYVPF